MHRLRLYCIAHSTGLDPAAGDVRPARGPARGTGGRPATARSRCPGTRARAAVFALLALLGCGQRAPPETPSNPITPETHTRFPITSGVHAVGCNSCHGAYDTFQQFTCLNCHVGTSTAHDPSTTDDLHRSLVA